MKIKLFNIIIQMNNYIENMFSYMNTVVLDNVYDF